MATARRQALVSAIQQITNEKDPFVRTQLLLEIKNVNHFSYETLVDLLRRCEDPAITHALPPASNSSSGSESVGQTLSLPLSVALSLTITAWHNDLLYTKVKEYLHHLTAAVRDAVERCTEAAVLSEEDYRTLIPALSFLQLITWRRASGQDEFEAPLAMTVLFREKDRFLRTLLKLLQRLWCEIQHKKAGEGIEEKAR